MQACLSPARIKSILTAVKRVREGQSLTVIQFQRLLGLMAAVSNVIPFGLLYMRPLQWWLRTKGFSPEGQPILHDQCHAARLTGLRRGRNHGSCHKAPCRRVTLTTDCLPHGLGGGTWVAAPPKVCGGSPSYVAHKLPGNAGRVSAIETFSPWPERPSCASSHRQHISDLLYKTGRGVCVQAPFTAGTPDPSVGPG